MKRVSDPQISPSGKWVLFSVTDVSLEKNSKVNHLWVVPLGGGKTEAGSSAALRNDKQKETGERQITSSSGESFGRFSPNGQFVSYTGAPTKDDPYSRITIATWDEKTGTIGMGRTLQAVSGDADGAVWSPDNKRFLFTTQVYPECSDKAMWSEEDACDKAKDEACGSVASEGSVVYGAALPALECVYGAEADACDRCGLLYGWTESAGPYSEECGGRCGDAYV